MTNWALVIGINKYQRLRSLEFAVQDAEAVRDFLREEVGFEQVFYFSDNSPDEIAPDGLPQSTQPTYANLWSFFWEFCEEPYLQAGDNFWFFFCGHGIRHQERDYLMPCDANPRAIEATAISISYVTERLRRCGADNVVLFLDACRNQGDRASLGIGLEKHQGIITIFSCSPRERAYEIEEIGQGSFTYALLESLRIIGEGNCATVERLYQRLCYRVAEINNYYNKPQQIPYIIVEPASKYHLILLPRQATLMDIATLREDAQEAELEGNLDLAEQLWIRVLAVSLADPKALKALRRIWSKGHSKASTKPKTTASSKSDRAVHFQSLQKAALLTSSQRIKSEVDLYSEKRADYTRLRDLLAAGKWKDADQETARVMLLAAGQQQRGFLQQEDIENFPCEDFRTIDRLWVKYSNGRFGFSVQKKIWLEVGGKLDYETECKLGDQLGWRKEGEWDYYKITFKLQPITPFGQLPVAGFLDSTQEKFDVTQSLGRWFGFRLVWRLVLFMRCDL